MRLAWQSVLLLVIFLAACGGDMTERPSKAVVFGTPTPVPLPTTVLPTAVVGDLVLLNNFVRGDGAVRVSYPGGWSIDSDGPAEAGRVIVANNRTALRGTIAGEDAYQLVMEWAPATVYGAEPDVVAYDLLTVFETAFPEAIDAEPTMVGDFAALHSLMPYADIYTQAAAVNIGGGMVLLLTIRTSSTAYEDLAFRIVAEMEYDGPRPIEDAGPSYWPVLYALHHDGDALVQGAAFMDRALITWDFAGGVYRWDLDTGAQDFALHHGARIAKAQLVGELLFVLPEGDGIYIYNAETGDSIRSFRPEFGRITQFQLSPDASLIAATIINNQNYSITVWSAETGALIETLRPATGETITQVAFNHAGTQVVMVGSAQQGRVFALEDGQRVLAADHTDEVLGAAWRGDDAMLATYGRDGYANVWMTSDGELRHQLVHTQSPPVGAIFNNDGSRLLTWTAARFATLWDVNTGAEIFRFETLPAMGGAFFSPDERLIISWANPAASTQQVHVVDAASGATVVRILESSLVGPAGYNAERDWLLVYGVDDEDGRLYALPNPDPIAYFQQSQVEGAAIHPTLPVVALWGGSGVVQVFNIADVAEASDD